MNSRAVSIKMTEGVKSLEPRLQMSECSPELNEVYIIIVYNRKSLSV